MFEAAFFFFSQKKTSRGEGGRGLTWPWSGQLLASLESSLIPFLAVT
jgi:hypothetical protein